MRWARVFEKEEQTLPIGDKCSACSQMFESCFKNVPVLGTALQHVPYG